MVNEIAIISAPSASPDQVASLVYAIEAEGKLPYPVYVTKAALEPITKDGILDWLEAIIKIANEQGWNKDISERIRNLNED